MESTSAGKAVQVQHAGEPSRDARGASIGAQDRESLRSESTQAPTETRPGAAPRGLESLGSGLLSIQGNKAYTNADGPEERLAARLDRYGNAKAENRRTVEWGAEHFSDAHTRQVDQLEKLSECGTWLHFRRRLDVGTNHLYRANHCRQHLLCQLCAILRASKVLQTYVPKVLNAYANTLGPECHFVTLTVRNSPSLLEAFQTLDAGLKRLTTRARLIRAGSRHRSVMGSVVGGVGAIEFKRGRIKRDWHPHYHGVWLFPGRPNYKQIRKEWSAILGYEAVAHVEPLHSQAADALSAGNDPEQRKAALAADLVEVFKYPLKFSDLEARDIWHAADVLAGKRLIRSFGNCRSALPESLLDEPVDWANVPYVDLIFRYFEGSYRDGSRPKPHPAFAEYAS